MYWGQVATKEIVIRNQEMKVIMRLIKQRDRLPRKAVELPSLEMFKICLDMALRKLS